MQELKWPLWGWDEVYLDFNSMGGGKKEVWMDVETEMPKCLETNINNKQKLSVTGKGFNQIGLSLLMEEVLLRTKQLKIITDLFLLRKAQLGVLGQDRDRG